MSDRPALSRRAALSVTLAGLAAASGCDAGQPVSPAGTPSGSTVPGDPDGSGSSQSASTSDAADDSDTRLVEEVAAALGRAAAVVAGASAVPGLRAALRDLAALHAGHLAVLEKEPPHPRASRRARPAAAWNRVRAQESQLQQQLVEWSVAAQSGALAKLLASMSAGVAQHLAVLPVAPPAPRGSRRAP